MRAEVRQAAAPSASATAIADFQLAAADRSLTVSGVRRRLPSGGAESLSQRVRGFFFGLPADHAPRLLVGALPFDREEQDYLYQPQSLAMPGFAASDASPPIRVLAARPEPDVASYKTAVRAALDKIADEASALTKVVLARSLVLTAAADIDPAALAARIADDPAAARFICPLPSRGKGPRALIGATPELLVSRRGRAVVSQPLAGSTPRRSDAGEDQSAAERLTASEKDRREHSLVVEAVLDTLASYCAELNSPDPHLISTTAMWHLASRIEGRLRDPDQTGAAELAAALHPTPAVCGAPRRAAMRAILELEPFGRGFYAGAVGWTREDGDGDWYVSLRCAEIEGEKVRLQAGAGIVAGSDPQSEADETSAKLKTMLRALGVDEHGRAAPGSSGLDPLA